MRFNPRANDPVTIILPDRRLSCRCAVHPDPVFAAADMPHAMTSDTATVYHLVSADGRGGDYALKVMDLEHRDPAMRDTSAVLAELIDLPGLAAARRECLTPETAPQTLEWFPDLSYATLMAWLSGTSWFDAHQGHGSTESLSPWSCFRLARRLAFVVAQLEARKLAHTVLAPHNVIVDVANGADTLELVGLEDIYSDGLPRSRTRPQAAYGYHHPAGRDREPTLAVDWFGLALLVAELLVWHSTEVRDALYGAESFFDPEELGVPGSERFGILHRNVAGTDASAAELLLSAWLAQSADECPSAADWHGALHAVGVSKIAYSWFRDDTYVAKVAERAPASTLTAGG